MVVGHSMEINIIHAISAPTRSAEGRLRSKNLPPRGRPVKRSHSPPIKEGEWLRTINRGH